ncbi:ComF family protein [Salinibacillus xinjiangensis]|uniref:Phosphoribosyltransferase domain-containing protein n=1 Tax=Salinibacillus xinjiangensis TaxID=1229268 RepID=A0A6G1X1L9_9BACI|nr:phosphoribosyltransferase family protein [Salinibacillus xinjiangensis]MRG84790.1 hypothetical protein [Salinibacillus xinjiangensis]
MNKWKYRGDYVLVNLFKAGVQKRFKEDFGKLNPTLVPIPLSATRQQERGFNQAEAIAQLLDLPIDDALTRVTNEKQAKKSRQQRLQSNNPFQLKNEVQGPILVIDDLYTTGATLHWAAYLLKRGGATTIDSFTLIRS